MVQIIDPYSYRSHSHDYYSPTNKALDPDEPNSRWWLMEAKLTAQEIDDVFGKRPVTYEEIWDKIFNPMGYTPAQAKDRLEDSRRLGFLEKTRIMKPGSRRPGRPKKVD